MLLNLFYYDFVFFDLSVKHFFLKFLRKKKSDILMAELKYQICIERNL